MSGKARGQVSVRRRAAETRYALRVTVAGKHHYLALGTDPVGGADAAAERAPVGRRDRGGSLGGGNCRKLTPAERALIVLGGGFIASDPALPARRNGRAGR